MGRMLRRGLAAACAGLALVAGGCGLGGGPAPTGDGVSTSSAQAASSASPSTPPSAQPSPSPSTTPSAEPSPSSSAEPSAPPGTQWVTGERSGLRFAVPEDWKVLELTKVLESGDQDALARIAQQMNLPVAQVKAAARSVDVAVFGPPSRGFAPNLNVQTLPLEVMPTEAQTRMVLKMIGATVASYEEVTTPVGRGHVTGYTLPVDTNTATGRQLTVIGPKGVVVLTVTDVDVDRADTVLGMLRASLHAR
ncbi:hypothetical protein [Phycicoccus sp.]|uniref:hypothetical protein n=1 Tax=Phycicoccus sp. TaxID=1902410 RepID=UPI002BFD794D|nr:hypothetical protein [Phycicoccus sp.]HMM94831.1 hypothetical protein [Phycicoccus sp.]